MINVQDRFESKWEAVTETGCHLWNHTPGSVYGLFWLDGKNEHAHRASWIINNGAIPKGKQVLHKCDVKGCVNPEHLYLGHHADNMADAKSRSRMQSGHAHSASHAGTYRTANDGNGVLNDSFCLMIKEFATKNNKQLLADTHGINLATIYRAITKADALLAALEES
jgi:hypothetical protein